MIETCEASAHVIVATCRQFFRSPAGAFFYALFTGAIGILVLLMFFSLILSATALPPALPVLVAFNSAASGYALIDKTRALRWRHRGLLLLAMLLTFSGAAAITLFCPWERMLDGSRLAITGFSSLALTYVGAWLADKKTLLQNNMESSTTEEEC